MLDIKFIRENKDIVKDGARKKHIDIDIEALIALDEERRKLMAIVESKRTEQNMATEKISRIGYSSQAPHLANSSQAPQSANLSQAPHATDQTERQKMIDEMRILKADLQKEEEKLKVLIKKWQALMVLVPNIPDMTVPEGTSDADNKEVRTWGEKIAFAFKPKGHIELMDGLDMVDFERGTKVAGFRGYFLKNDAVVLNFALWQFVFNHIVSKGFSPLMTPSLVTRESFIGTGYLPQSEEDLYKTQDGNYLTGTSEVPAMGYYMDEIIDKAKLPIKFVAFSPCFRREAGSHGKDVKGLYRVHEFFKFEQIILCAADHQESVAFHEALTVNSEEILQALQLPYHVVVNCGGDLGLGQVKKYDIETWIPSQSKYGETHSSSYFHDFQTRRLNIRYKDHDGKIKFAHSLNNTAIASPRILISLLENYQNEDGSVRVPDVLQKYVGKAVFKKQ